MRETLSMESIPMTARVQYKEIDCRSALNRVKKSMGFSWSLNPYRGCVHGCHYCFARRYHSYLDLGVGSDFTNVIFVKRNVADVLGYELSSRSWRRETVALGTATDPYQPIEGKYRLTRRCLEMFAAWRSPVSVVTKGTMAVRDVDVMAELERIAGCTVCFSVTTLDEQTWKRLEPGTPPPAKRLETMQRLVEAGVNAGVGLAPIVPGLTDSRPNLESVAAAAAAHGARFLWGGTLYLQPGTKEDFFKFLRRTYPNLTTRYRTLYPGAYAPRPVEEEIQARVQSVVAGAGLAPRRSRQPAPRPRQTELALGWGPFG